MLKERIRGIYLSFQLFYCIYFIDVRSKIDRDIYESNKVQATLIFSRVLDGPRLFFSRVAAPSGTPPSSIVSLASLWWVE